MSSPLKENWVIIDANNFIHQHRELSQLARLDFERARHDLVRRLTELAGVLARRITVVFDGRAGARVTALEATAVEVIFSPSHLTADSVIERLVHEAPEPAHVTVVSSDHMERDTVEAAGVQTISCRNFTELMQAERARLDDLLRPQRCKPAGTKLGEFFPG